MKDSSPGALPDEKTVISRRAPLAAGGQPTRPVDLGKSLEGQHLGHFRLEEFVGGGGMGAVFRAVDTMLGRTVAVKVVGSVGTGDDTLRRFRNEAQSAARLDHENIARVYYVGEDAGWNYIVFEFIEGVNIRDLVDHKGPLSLDEAVTYTLQVADALDHASRRDVVHRDIKPSNVLVTADGRAKLVDMGLARLHQVESTSEDLTASGVTLGTFDYISPEQARDPRATDVRSDLYSLGCTFYFMLTGYPPFPHGTVLQKLLSHSSEEPPDPSQYRDDLTDEIIAVLNKLLAKNPRDRYQEPRELIVDLKLLAEHLGLTNATHAGKIWIAPSGPRESFFERHLPWLVPVATLIVAATLLEQFTRSSEPFDLAAPDFATRVAGPGELPGGFPQAGAGQAPAEQASSPEGPAADPAAAPERAGGGTTVLPWPSGDASRSTDAGANEAAGRSNAESGAAPSAADLEDMESVGEPRRPAADGASSDVPAVPSPPGAAAVPNGGGNGPEDNGSGREENGSGREENGSGREENGSGREVGGEGPPGSGGARGDSLPPLAAMPQASQAAPENGGRFETPFLNSFPNPAAETISHVIVGPSGGGQAVAGGRRVDSLQQAVALAAELPSVESIELHFNGPHVVEPPLDFPPELLARGDFTIRAAADYQPQIVFRPQPEQLGDRQRPVMIRVGQGTLRWIGVHLNFELPLDDRQAWSLFQLERVESLHLEQSTLTIRNRHGAMLDDHVSFFELKPPPDDPAGMGMDSEAVPAAPKMRPTSISLVRCSVRGQATLVRGERSRALHLTWQQGFFSSSQRLLDMGGLKNAPQFEEGIIRIDLRHLTAVVGPGLCRLRTDMNHPHQRSLMAQFNNCLFLVDEARAPIFEYDGTLDMESIRTRLNVGGDGNYYENTDVILRVRTLDAPSFPNEVTLSAEDRARATSEGWYREIEPQPASMLNLNLPSSSEQPADLHRRGDFAVERAEGSMEVVLPGFQADSTPEFPAPPAEADASADSEDEDAVPAPRSLDSFVPPL